MEPTSTDGQINGLAVVLLLASDADRTAAFYRDVLGLPLKAERHDGRHTHYACPMGGLYFTIQPRADLGEPPATGYDSLQLCFTTPSMDTFQERLARLGVRALHPPRAFEHTTFTTLVDPDGRHVRVMTPWDTKE
ncbi:MAG TPA: VOC family protein [Verrucomicrobiota bacterium]|nr:hypothetical protein [Verrucomicrobiales bacterium]HRI12652.1 VOC family protein [Verrucomicrobiota bacterium]